MRPCPTSHQCRGRANQRHHGRGEVERGHHRDGGGGECDTEPEVEPLWFGGRDSRGRPDTEDEASHLEDEAAEQDDDRRQEYGGGHYVLAQEPRSQDHHLAEKQTEGR